jgi:hypothetical protein
MPSRADHRSTDGFTATIRQIVAAAPDFARDAHQAGVWRREDVDPESRLFLLFSDLWEWLVAQDDRASAHAGRLGPVLDAIARRGPEDPVTRLMANSLPDDESPGSTLPAVLPQGVLALLESERAALARAAARVGPEPAASDRPLRYETAVPALARELDEFRAESVWLEDEADWDLVTLVFDEFDAWLDERALLGDAAAVRHALSFVERLAEAADADPQLENLLAGSVFCDGEALPAIERQLGPRSRALLERARAES